MKNRRSPQANDCGLFPFCMADFRLFAVLYPDIAEQSCLSKKNDDAIQ